MQTQNNEPFIWASVDQKSPIHKRRIYIVPTGVDFEFYTDIDYIGTFQLNGGALVFHLWMGPYRDYRDYYD